MPTLTSASYFAVYNLFSFAIAVMGAAFVHAILQRKEVAPRFRGAIAVSALVVGIACYHYFRIFNAWEAAFTLTNGNYAPSGKPFNEAYRFVDWFLTVPLLVIEVLGVLALAPKQQNGIYGKLIWAAILMIAFGAVGQFYEEAMPRTIWGILSTVAFIYLIATIWKTISNHLSAEPAQVQTLWKNLRWLMLATWGVYPIVYSFPQFGLTSAGAFVSGQIAFTMADMLAKAYFGVILFQIAQRKSNHEAVLSR